jgi:hypothetical protein
MSEPEKIDRREAIRRASLMMGSLLSPPLVSALLSGCGSDRAGSEGSPSLFSVRQMKAAADLAEVILPETDTPGAKAARTEQFIDAMVSEALPKEQSDRILSMLDNLIESGFPDLSFPEQSTFIGGWIEDPENRSLFLLFKQMTLLGFFSSEIGASVVLNYDPIPGGYRGCISLKDAGGKTWAT